MNSILNDDSIMSDKALRCTNLQSML